jgi:hypothetical protein
MDANDQWYLKKYDDGSVFGPVEVETLVGWASKGEISPYDMLSRDAVKWMAAPELPQLDMNWIVEFPDGEAYGPTCIPAIRAFLDDGQLRPDNSIRNATTGDSCLIAEHPDFQEYIPAGSSDKTAGTDAAVEEAMSEELEQLRQRVTELEETNEATKASHEAIIQDLTEQLATAQSELEQLQRSNQSTKAEKEVSSNQMRAELAQVREQFELLSDLNGQLRKNHEEALAELNERVEAALAMLDNDLQREVELNRQVAEAAQRESQYRAQIVELEKELVKSQQAQAGLLEKFAKLNEKLEKYLGKGE